MRLPIQYALTYPDRPFNDSLPRLDWKSLTALTFEQPDVDRFPCLRLAVDAGRAGGIGPAVLCAADDAAVELFLAGRIGFTDIPRLIGRALEKYSAISRPSLDDILAAGDWARQQVLEMAGGGGR
jgi:1-deoxy-D-xylulose-5-phosphate reductoisomerase